MNKKKYKVSELGMLYKQYNNIYKYDYDVNMI